ncbi:mCG147244 [Mus musculus]|nr:mCG147244 [Mus musculus]
MGGRQQKSLQACRPASLADTAENKRLPGTRQRLLRLPSACIRLNSYPLYVQKEREPSVRCEN